MGGRILQASTPVEMAALLGCAPPYPNAEPRYNGFPSQRFIAIRCNLATKKQLGLTQHSRSRRAAIANHHQ